jgi:hypothetical protein
MDQKGTGIFKKISFAGNFAGHTFAYLLQDMFCLCQAQ